MHSKPARPLSRESGTSREVAVHLSNFTPDAVRTSRYRGRAPCPIQWALSLSSCSTRPHGGLSRPPYGVGCRGAVPLDSTHYSAGCCPCQQFFEKIFQPFFSKIMKTHARVGVRKTGEKRRKQGFRARKSFLKKSEKRAKKIFPSCCTTAPRLDRQRDSGQGTPGDVVLKTIWYRVIHREKWLSTGFSTRAKKHRKAQNAQKCTERV